MDAKSLLDRMQALLTEYRSLPKDARALVRSAILEAPHAERQRTTRAQAGHALDRQVLQLLADKKNLRRIDVADELQRARSTISKTIAGLLQRGKVVDRAGILHLAAPKKPAKASKADKEEAYVSLEARLVKLLPAYGKGSLSVREATDSLAENAHSVSSTLYRMKSKGVCEQTGPGLFCLAKILDGPKNGHVRVEETN